MRALTCALTLTAVCAAPSASHAFCGFYVSGADAELYNNATVVALMRDGTRTVMSMQNDYQGPPEDFAMVVPVPVVLEKKQVRTLPKEIFDRLDQLAAPRLVEYWEQDPCNPYPRYTATGGEVLMVDSAGPPAYRGKSRNLGVKVEAKFAVGEYQIVILSAKDSTGLDTWLRQEGYQIPDGAEAVLRPYVSQGMKFFVAKVDVEKVTFEDGKAVLSPLRVYYDSEQFNLPVRLGMINSEGSQDLIVHVLARMTRYEVANYDNVTIPTNLELKPRAKEEFGAFYQSLFQATLEAHPNAVVTEYAWFAGKCDPCPTPGLNPNELATLGLDVLPMQGNTNFVLTRLHARYPKGALGDDLVFRAAPPIAGGRERHGPEGDLERGATAGGSNNFQGRYIIRHEWTGPIECDDPKRGIWGGPPDGSHAAVIAAEDVGFSRGEQSEGERDLSAFVTSDIGEIDFELSRGDSSVKFRQTGIDHRGCAGCAASGRSLGLAGLLVLGLAVFLVCVRRK